MKCANCLPINPICGDFSDSYTLYSVYSYHLKFSEPCQVHFVLGPQNSQLLLKKQSKNMITE